MVNIVNTSVKYVVLNLVISKKEDTMLIKCIKRENCPSEYCTFKHPIEYEHWDNLISIFPEWLIERKTKAHTYLQWFVHYGEKRKSCRGQFTIVQK